MAGYNRSASLNSRQAEFFDAVMKSLAKREAAMFFLEGPAGTGKTHLLNVIYEEAFDQGKKVSMNDSLAVGSTLLVQGGTAHSSFLLPWNPKSKEKIQVEDRGGIQPGSQRAKWLEKVDLILWDEVSSSTKQDLKTADDEMRVITGVDAPFGGKIVVFSGDRRGLPPPEYKYFKSCPFEWEFWPEVRMYSLIENHRYDENQTKWEDKLLEIGSGGCAIDSPNPDCCKKHAYLNIDMIVGYLGDLIKNTFAECIDENDRKPTYGRAILTLTNNRVIDFNKEILHYLYKEKNVITIFGQTTVKPEGSYNYARLPEHHTPSGYPPHELKLAVGCEVILLKNINTWILEDTGVNGEFCNGAILTVAKISQEALTCTIRDGFNSGRTTIIKKEMFDKDSDIIRYQFPVRLSYAMTIHKAKGRTLDKVGLIMETDVWTHGQLYTALSRVRRQEDIKISLGQKVSKKNVDDQIIAIHNEVDPQIFSKANTAEQLKVGVGKEEKEEEQEEEKDEEGEDEEMQ